MAVKMPDLVAYGERVNKTQNNSGGVQMPNLVAYGKRVETRKAKETKAVTPSASPRPMENASTGNNRPNSRLLADVQTGGTTPPSLDNGRVGKVISGAAKSTGSAFTNLGGVLAEGAGYLNTRIANQNAGASLQSDHDAVKRYEKMLRDVKWANGKAMTAADVKQVQGYLAAAKRRIAAHEGYTKAVEQSDKAVADKAYQKADRLSQSSAADVAQAKEGLGPVGQFAVDVGVAGAQMAGDMAVGALTGGSALPAMFVRSVGSAAQEARQSGATYGQQLGYGLGSGALSVATEKISNVADPFKKFFGEGLADKAAGKLIARFGESDAVRIMKRLAETPGGKAALSFISEGGEEAIEDIAQPILQTIYNGKRYSTVPEYIRDLDAKEIAHDALVGGALGLVGSAAENVQRAKRGQQATQQAVGGQAEAAEGNYTPAPANAPDGTQNAVPNVETAPKYDALQADAIRHEGKTFRNLVAGFDTSVSEFFNKWRNGRKNTETEKLEKLYLGKMSEDAKRQASNILGYEIDSRDMIVTSDDVKHILDSHGNAEAELQRGNQPLEQWAIDAIPDVVTQPDSIVPGSTNTSGKHPGKQGVIFSKTMPNGTVVTVQFDNKGRKTMELTTMYVKKSGPTIQAFNVENTSPQLTAKPVPESVSSASSDLTPAEARLAGPSPVPSSVASSPVEGTRPLNANDSIAQGTENVKNGESRDILSEVLFGKKRADLNTMTEAQQDAIFRANEEGTVGMDATGKVFQIDPEQHIDRRRMETVGGRDVNAFQFDHPELHRYYQEAANALIADADLSLQQPMSRRYERTMEGNAVQQAAQTSPHLRQAMDETGLTRDSIIDAAKRIVQDSGQENVAAAKRVELILDDMLSHGYTTMTGEQVGPNSGYLTAKQSILGAGETQARGHGLDGIDNFDGLGNADAGTVNTPFDTMQAKSEEFHPVNPNSAERVRNDQRRAPSEVPVVNPDTGRNVEKTVSTILNSPLTSPEMATVYENAIAGGAFDYDVVTDRSAVEQAQAKIARDGWREVANSFIAKSELGQRITKADTAEAISAYNLAIAEGDNKTAFELSTAIADAAHDSAQMVQAMNLMNRLTPEGRLLTLRRLVDRMNDRAARQNRTPRQSTANNGDVESARVDYIDKVTGFTLSDELATNYLMAETDAERAAAWDAITTSIADQIPSTFREKANFWRYTSMLTNPTTHIRNIMGNAIQFGARKIKDGVGTALERAAIKDPSQRTKAVNVDKDLKAFAKGQYETDQNAAMGSGKYSDATAAGIEREIQSKRKMFKGEDVLSRAVQGIGDLNSRALDYEDVIFNRAAYVDSFAQALQAKGVTAAEAHAGTRAADVEAARAYAIEEAQKATYRNTTVLSEALSKRGRYDASDNIVERGISFVTDALLPFRKTPANILTTGLDYSPIGLGKGIKEAMFDVKSGKCTAADAVDSLASGLTGTGIFALGAYLAAEGLLHVRAGDDDKEEDFEKATGGQDYALQIDDKSYSLDWAVPAAMPLFAGAAIMESAQKGGGTFDAVADALLGMQDVVLETSMLSSLNDLIANISYADSPVLYIADKAASSYAGQYIPTIGSKAASAFDDTVRKSYVEKGTGQLSSDVSYFLQGAAKKAPGVRNQLQPSIDLWGNEVSNGSAPERVLQSFISPGYFKTQDNSPATQEIRRLAKATGESSVYPAAAEKSFMVNGETKYLTGEEYTKYAKTMGSTRKQIIENMLKSKGYQKLSDDDKAKAISYAYEYANVKGKQAVSSYKPSNRSFSKGALASVLPPDMYILYKVTADKDNNGSVTSVESAQALKDLTGLTDSQRGKAWAEKNSTTKPEKNPFTGALVEAGASVSTSISVLDKYRELYNAEGMKPKEKAADFRAYVYGLGLTPSQIAAAQSTYTFFGSYPIEW